MRLADFPLFDPDVYVVRADVSAPKLLNPLAQVRAWQDDAGYVWLAQGKELVELDGVGALLTSSYITNA